MDADFDLYGDADIYGGVAAKDEENQEEQKDEIDYLAETKNEQESVSNSNSNNASAGSKRGREDGATDGSTGDKNPNRYPSPGVSRPNDGGSASGQYQPGAQYQPRQEYNNNNNTSGSSRMAEDTAMPSDPASARIALAGKPKVTDPNVQNALLVGELDWWVSDEEIRKIAQEAGVFIELPDVTFSEHKVNGKSKGVAYVETSSEDDARRLASWFDNNDINFKRATVTLTTSANGNPFKILPKDPPPKENRPMRGGRGGPRDGMMGGGRGGGRDGGGMGNVPMAGAPIRMGSGANGGAGGMPMMNPMMMGMMGGGGGGGGGRPPMFMGGGNFGGGGGGMGRGGGGGGGYGRGGGRPPMNPGMGHFNPNFFGGMQGQGQGQGGGGRGGGGRDDQDRDRKRYRQDDNY